MVHRHPFRIVFRLGILPKRVYHAKCNLGASIPTTILVACDHPTTCADDNCGFCHLPTCTKTVFKLSSSQAPNCSNGSCILLWTCHQHLWLFDHVGTLSHNVPSGNPRRVCAHLRIACHKHPAGVSHFHHRCAIGSAGRAPWPKNRHRRHCKG